MSQPKEDEPTDHREQNELSPLNCRVSELILAYRSFKSGQEKHFYSTDLLESHASLFHAIQSIVKSWRKTAESEVKKSDADEDVVKEYFSALKDIKEDKGSCGRQPSKSICRVAQSKHLISKSKSVLFSKEKKPDVEELPPSRLLPYLVLIKNCVPLPYSILQRLCLSGEIQCRFQHFARKRRKKKEITLPESKGRPVREPQKVTDLQYVTFDSLIELQWKLFKGLVKRKPKTIGVWKEPSYTYGIKSVRSVEKSEYILPLIPKDYAVDESLRFSEEMRHLLLQYDPHEWKGSI